MSKTSKNPTTGRFQPRQVAQPMPNEGAPAAEPPPSPLAKIIATVGASVAAVFQREVESLAEMDAKISAKRDELHSGEHEMGRAALATDEGDEAAALAFARAEARVRRLRDELRALELKRDAMVERQGRRVDEAKRRAAAEREAEAQRRIANMHVIASSADEDVAALALKTRSWNENAAALLVVAPHMEHQVATARTAFERCLSFHLKHMPDIKPKPFMDGGNRWVNYCPTPELHAALVAQQQTRQSEEAA